MDAAPALELGGICSVHADDVSGGRHAIEHLLDLGHRRILMLNGPNWMRQCTDREAGARDAIERSGDRGVVLDVAGLDELSYRAGEHAVERLAANGTWPWTAVFCAQDAVAVGAQRALRRGGRRVPEDVSIVGYDNVDAAAFAPVPLTTVAKPRALMGETGARLLLAELEADSEHQHVGRSIEPELIVRESTVAPGG